MKVRNGILKGELKVEGGKLIKCLIKLKDNKIEEIRFSGDFFMYPEEKLEEIEKALKNVSIEEIEEIFDTSFKNVEIIGATKEDFINLLKQLIEKD